MQNGTFWAFTGQLNSISPYSRSIFDNFHRNKVFNFFVFLYVSVQSPDAKSAQIVIIIIIIISIIIIIIINIINTLFEIGKIYIALQNICSIIRP